MQKSIDIRRAKRRFDLIHHLTPGPTKAKLNIIDFNETHIEDNWMWMKQDNILIDNFISIHYFVSIY